MLLVNKDKLRSSKCMHLSSSTIITLGTKYSDYDVHSFTSITPTALLNEDYRGVRQQALTFGPSVSVICTSFSILNDDLLESTEYVTLSLSAPVEDIAVVNFSTPQSTIEILEDSIDGIYNIRMCEQ